MAKNYLTYPCKVMKITQNYNGKTSHYPHIVGSPKDYPIDEGCADTGRDWMYCPCDEMKVVKLYGVGNRGTNTIWLQSTSKVYFADGTSNYFTMMIIHPNDDDMRKLWVGQTFTRGQTICREGIDGATGYHLHISGGKGKMQGGGWAQNSKGKWVLTTTGGTFKPEQLFYIDTAFTKVISYGGITFKNLPKSSSTATQEGYTIGDYKVTADTLNVRKGAGTLYAKVTYDKMTENAKKKIVALAGKKVDGYVKGLTFTVTQIKGKWGKTPSGWVCLDYCKKI